VALKDELASLKIDQSARAGGGRRGLWISTLILVVVAATGAWFWTQRVHAEPVTTATVVARSGGAGSAAAVLNASGYVVARRRATVSSKVTGKVVEVNVEEGQAVRKGQVLARLDDSQVRSALSVAEAQLALSRRGAAEDQAKLREAELSRDRRLALVKEGVVGKAELDTAQSEVESLQARIAYSQEQILVSQSQVNARRTDLDDMVVRAPFDGVAISKDAQPGEMISPVSAGGGFTRTGICTIVDMSSLEVEVDVNESYINRVRPGQPVEAVLDAYPDWRIPAHVITSVPSADRAKATVKVRIGFHPSASSGSPRGGSKGEKLDPRILPDMGVKVSFLAEPTPQSAAPVTTRLLVPKGALRKIDGRDVVFVVKEDLAERRAVTVGGTEGDQVEIASGLQIGERVIIEGPATLTDGSRVTVKER
jgi:RND family efflux transporter MFP subunit